MVEARVILNYEKPAMSIQFVVNTIYSFLLLAAVSSSFFVVFKPSKYFHISHAAVIVLSPYCFGYLVSIGSGAIIAVLASLLLATFFGLLNELLFYRRLSRGKDAGLNILVLSLGVYLVVQNAISLFFGDQINLVDPCAGCLRKIIQGSHFLVSVAQLVSASVSFLVIATLLLIWYKTSFGRKVRSVSENRDLAGVVGVDVDRVVLLSVGLGSLVAGMVGLVIGFEVGVTPTAGFSYLLYGIIAMVIGGSESLVGSLAGAFVLATLQSMASYYIDSKWGTTVSYTLLVGFMLIRPRGVSSLNLAVERQ